MNKKVIFGLLFVFVLAGFVIWAIQSQQKYVGESQQQLGRLFPKLKRTVNDIRSLTINKPNETPIELVLADDKWKYGNASGYPIRTEQLRSLLVRLSSAKLVATRTKDVNKFVDIGLDETSRTTIEAFDESGKSLLHLHVGSYSNESKGTYVLRGEEKQSYIIDQRIDPKTQKKDWLDVKIANIASNRIQQITIDNPQQKPILLFRDDANADFVVTGVSLTENQQYKKSDVNNVSRLLENLNLIDVLAVADFDTTGVKPIQVNVTTFDGLQAKIQAYKADDVYWVSYEFGVLSSVENLEGDESADVKQKRLDDRQQEVSSLQAVVGDWLYQLPTHQLNRITVLANKLVEDKPEQKPEEKPANVSQDAQSQ